MDLAESSKTRLSAKNRTYCRMPTRRTKIAVRVTLRADRAHRSAHAVLFLGVERDGSREYKQANPAVGHVSLGSRYL